jgi:hypothetical protein
VLSAADKDVVEEHVPLLTVKVYVVPAVKPVTVVVVPVPVADPLGEPVIVQVPLEGKPLKATLPVATEHVGCVIVPTTGVVGTVGAAFTTAFPDDGDEQPATVNTVNV